MALSDWRIRTQTMIPNVDIVDWDPSLDLCNVNIQHIKFLTKGKTLRIRVRFPIRLRQCKIAIRIHNIYQEHLPEIFPHLSDASP